MQVTKHAGEGSTLALKPGQMSLDRAIIGLHKRTTVLQKCLQKVSITDILTTCSKRNIGEIGNREVQMGKERDSNVITNKGYAKLERQTAFPEMVIIQCEVELKFIC